MCGIEIGELAFLDSGTAKETLFEVTPLELAVRNPCFDSDEACPCKVD